MSRFISFSVRLVYRLALTLIALACLGFALMQTKWAKEKVRSLLVEELQAQGIAVDIQGIEGRLPFTWGIDRMDLTTQTGSALTISHAKVRLKILPLLQRQIIINYLNIEQLDVAFTSDLPSQPADWTVEHAQQTLQTTLQTLKPALHLAINHLTIERLNLNNLTTHDITSISIDARGKWRRDNREFLLNIKITPPGDARVYCELFLNGNQANNRISSGIKFHLENRDTIAREWLAEATLSGPWNTWQALIWQDAEAELPLKGKLKGRLIDLHLPQSLVSFPHTWQFATELCIHPERLLSVKGELNAISDHSIAGTVHALFQHSRLEGTLSVGSTQSSFPFQSSLNILWTPATSLQLSDISFTSAETTLHGEVALDLSTHLANGTLYGQAGRLESLSPLIKEIPVEGSLGIECTFSSEHAEQTAEIHLFSQNLRYADTTAKNLTLLADLHDLGRMPYGTIELNATNLYTRKLEIHTVNLKTSALSPQDKQWAFQLSSAGEFLDPFQLLALGNWTFENRQFSLEFKRVEGSLATEPIYLQHPCSVIYSPTQFTLSPCAWTVGDGSCELSADLSALKATAHLQMTHFPLNTLTLLYPNFVMNGTTTASGSLEATQDKITGNFNAVLEKTGLLYHGKEEPLETKGSIQVHLDNQILQLHSLLTSRDGQFLDLSASLPIVHQLSPLTIAIAPDQPLHGEMIAEGKIEEIFDFVNIGSHHITGLISSRLLLSQTFRKPALQGMIDWQHGSYENYYTGTSLKEIEVHMEAEKNHLNITSLAARDEEGTLSAEGTLILSAEKHFPYEISAELNNLNALRFDLINAHLSGPLYLTGSTQSALIEGNITVPKAKIQIPDQLPYEIPNLPVTFINRPSHLAIPQSASSSPFPVHLDLELTAEDQVYVGGKGLSSEWKGSVHLTGTNLTFTADGKLDLMNGEYLFTGKIFKLTEGQIVFHNKPTATAYISLSGILNLQDVEVMAQLHGPLTSPQLTFQSNPHMTTSAILSRILFNKDISDISQTEAIQLATTLMDLSGGATPGVMDAIRKTLGIDRLTIVPSDKNEIALQIGKYLTKGVLVTLSQSATSTQVIVEVELKEGFVFQAETQEEQEGKFSLKWRRNY